jgi:hypothetical protein
LPEEDGEGVVDVSAGCDEPDPLSTVPSWVVPDVVFVELFAWVTIGGGDCPAPSSEVTAKLATAAHAVATPTPTAASSA